MEPGAGGGAGGVMGFERRRGSLTVEDFVLAHAVGVPVSTEADDN